jgi:hypothetical protein
MVHLTNDFDFDSTIKGFNYQGVHSFDVALSARSRKLLYFRKAKRREAKVIGCRIAEPQDRVIQLLTSGKVCNQSTVADGPVSASLQQLLAKQAKRILKRLHTGKPKG